jgi:hypothetical protein
LRADSIRASLMATFVLIFYLLCVSISIIIHIAETI